MIPGKHFAMPNACRAIDDGQGVDDRFPAYWAELLFKVAAVAR